MYVPKHRGPAPERSQKSRLRTAVLVSGAAVAATGIAVSSGILAQQDAVGDDASAALRAAPHLEGDVTTDLAERVRSTSRSDDRTAVDEKSADDKSSDKGQADSNANNKKRADGKKRRERSTGDKAARTARLSAKNPRAVARALLPTYGFSADQFGCLNALYISESNWNPRADNPTSSAYGIPQALTETHDLPDDYMTNPVTQIRWGLGYIRSAYGTPCAAWQFKQANNWY
jgi:hypothetical protein